MGKWLAWLREHRKDWPVLVSIPVSIFNTEVATPLILVGILGLSGRRLGIAAGIWSSIELCWWIYFAGWVYKNKIRNLATINEAINLGQEAKKEFDLGDFLLPNKRDHYLIAKIKSFIRKHSIDNFDPNRYRDDHFFIRLINVLKVLGYILACSLIFLMGLLPLWWMFALMACQLLGWKSAYLALFTSNFIKNYFLALIYDKIGFWWWIGLFVLSVVAMSYFLKMIVKKIKQRGEKT